MKLNDDIFEKLSNIEALIASGELKEAPENEPERQYYFMAKLKEYVSAKKKELGRDLYACTKTFGCQMNARDSEKLVGILKVIGYEETESEKADFVVYNTCTVRENANLKVYGHLGLLSNYKKKNPEMKIAMCGCMMQEAHVVEKIKKSYRFVDVVFGTHNIYKFAELLYMRIVKNAMIIDIWEDTTKIVEELPLERKFSFKSGVNIMFGCNNFCSYCIVPYVRGRERSRDPKDIINEIKMLSEDGVVEIMLLGQNVNSYGKGCDFNMNFAELIRRIDEIEGDYCFDFMTSHPRDCSLELIDALSESKHFCGHLHLPVQSGNNRILKEMNRHYTREHYLELVNYAKKKIPGVDLTTDIIVGFPGETYEEFLDTVSLVKEVKYGSMFTFIYSARKGTPAAEMPDPFTKEEKTKWFMELLKVQEEIAGK